MAFRFHRLNYLRISEELRALREMRKTFRELSNPFFLQHTLFIKILESQFDYEVRLTPFKVSLNLKFDHKFTFVIDNGICSSGMVHPSTSI